MINVTPAQLKKKLELNQAKEWGYKTAAAANKDGYNVSRNTCTVAEFKAAFSLSDNEARVIVEDWKYNGLAKYTNHCGLDQIQFITK